MKCFVVMMSYLNVMETTVDFQMRWKYTHQTLHTMMCVCVKKDTNTGTAHSGSLSVK